MRVPTYARYRFVVGGDWGSAAPATGILLGQLKADVGPMKYGSIIALDETDTADPSDLSLGNGAPPQMFAEMVKEMAARNGCRAPQVVMDDARGLQSETVIQLFRQTGLPAHKPYKKDRIGQWNLIRQLLANAVTGDGPGLYFTERCRHLIETLPEAPRGTLRAEDIDPKWNRDHWIDALAYGVRELHGNRITNGRAQFSSEGEVMTTKQRSSGSTSRRPPSWYAQRRQPGHADWAGRVDGHLRGLWQDQRRRPRCGGQGAAGHPRPALRRGGHRKADAMLGKLRALETHLRKCHEALSPAQAHNERSDIRVLARAEVAFTGLVPLIDAGDIATIARCSPAPPTSLG